MSEHKHLFTIRTGRWYTWQMLPGYTADDGFSPYYSPIYVERITPMKTKKRMVKFDFINAMYAAGVQGFEPTLRVLKRSGGYLIAEYPDFECRAAIIGEITFGWLHAVMPKWLQLHPLDRVKEPYKSDVQLYLDARLRVRAELE